MEQYALVLSIIITVLAIGAVYRIGTCIQYLAHVMIKIYMTERGLEKFDI